MEDGHLEATHLGEAGVDVEGVVVTGQPVDGGLLLSGLLLDNDIRGASGGLVGSSSGATVSRLLLPTETTAPSEEDGHLVVKDLLASLSVGGGDSLPDNSGVALVNNLDELTLGDELAGGGDWVLLDLEVLLAVEEHHGVEVGNEVIKRVGELGIEWGNDAEGGDGLEVLSTLKYVAEIGALGTDTKVVKHDVALGVVELSSLALSLEGFLLGLEVLVIAAGALKIDTTAVRDQVQKVEGSYIIPSLFYTKHYMVTMVHEKMGCSYLSRAGLVLHIRHDLLETVLGLRGMVGAVVKSDDVVPVLDNLLRSQGNVDGEAVTSSALPPGLADPTAANLVEATGGVGNLVAGESEDERSNVVGLEGLDKLLGKDGLGHGSTGVGGDSIDEDVVLRTLERKSAREAENGAFLHSS